MDRVYSRRNSREWVVSLSEPSGKHNSIILFIQPLRQQAARDNDMSIKDMDFIPKWGYFEWREFHFTTFKFTQDPSCEY